MKCIALLIAAVKVGDDAATRSLNIKSCQIDLCTKGIQGPRSDLINVVELNRVLGQRPDIDGRGLALVHRVFKGDFLANRRLALAQPCAAVEKRLLSAVLTLNKAVVVCFDGRNDTAGSVVLRCCFNEVELWI